MNRFSKIYNSAIFKAFFFLSLYSFAGLVSAHSGRTDAKGGHNQYSDGTYHYHNSGAIGNSSGDWSIFTWLVVLFLLYIVGLFVWSYFNDGENNKAPISSVNREESIPDIIPRRPDNQRRGEDSRAAQAAREATSSIKRSRGRESTAEKALKKAKSSSRNTSESENLYFDNIKNQKPKNPTKEDFDDKEDDLYFDNRLKK